MAKKLNNKKDIMRRGQATQTLARGKPFRQIRKSFLIACEDSKSAPSYFKSFGNELRPHFIQVEIAPYQGSDPKNVVLAAKKVAEERDFSEVWCVFDVEGTLHPNRRSQIKQAIEQARQLRFKTAVSNPSFEYWILLHFHPTTELFQNGTAVIQALKKYYKSYDKGECCYQVVREHTDTAIAHAKRLFRERCKAHADDPCECLPCTQVHILIETLLSAVKKVDIKHGK
jgi:hypothetical protein